MIKLLFLNY